MRSAYLCEPNVGEKPGVGWHWAIGLARLGYEVWVLTAARPGRLIEEELALRPRSNLQFRYYEPPKWVASKKKGVRAICGRVMQTKGKKKSKLGRDLADLHEDSTLLERLSLGARRRTGALSWGKQVESINSRLGPDVRSQAP